MGRCRRARARHGQEARQHITTISEDEKARWIKATEPVIDGWIKQVKDKGLDGAKLLEQAKALVAKYDKA